MNFMASNKVKILTPIAAIGGTIAQMLGGWSTALATLVIFMAVDYATGLIVAGVFHTSKKTENGRLESHAGLKGIAKKVACLLAVLVAYRLDLVSGTSFIRDSLIIGLVGNEAISILENFTLMGLEIPVLSDAIEVLKKKSKSE